MELMKRLAIGILIAVLFTQLAYAKELTNRNINMHISSQGTATVVEEFVIALSPQDSREVDPLIEKGTSDIYTWNKFFSVIRRNVLGEYRELSVVAKKDTQGFARISLGYKIDNLPVRISEEGRIITKAISPRSFAFFDSNGEVFTLPSDATIQIQIEDQRQSRERQRIEEFFAAKPAGAFLGPYSSENTVLFIVKGPLVTKDFLVLWKEEQSIGQSFSTSRILESAYRNLRSSPIYTLAVMIILGLLVIYRKQALAVIAESFSEEEIEMPKREL
ncbi:MAG: hypothetical protein J4432_04600 [DPANN group archaeon]|nr:hypothetical protein [DPANN group archaeon]